jgi:hypothetical protein
LEAFWVFTVLPVPERVTVDVPFVKVEDAPDVSQLPVTVHDPVVSVIVPEDPPVIVTSETLPVDALAVKTPRLPTVKAPPVRPRLAVARAVVEPLPETVSVPAHRRPFVFIVNVTVPLPAVDWKTTLLSSATLRFEPAKVIVALTGSLNVAVPDPALQEAEVEAFVQVPLTVHASEPKAMYDAAAETFTLPEIVTAPDVLRRAPPAIVRFPFTVKAFVPFVRDPALRFIVEAVSGDDWEIVPVTVRVAKLWPARSLTVLAVPERVTVDVPGVSVDPAPDVSQLPLALNAPDPEKLITPLEPPVIVTSVALTVPLVMLSVVPFPTVTVPNVHVDVLPVIPPVPTSERAAPPVTLLPEVVSVPDPDVASVLLTSTAVVCETVPETVRL